MSEESYTDYSMMLGITDRLTDEQLKAELDRYRDKLGEVSKSANDTNKKVNFFQRNVDGLTKMLGYRDEAKMKRDFVLTKDHVALLKNMEFVEFKNGGDYVFLGVEGKRPFGNSDIYRDAAEILKIKINRDEELSDKQCGRISKLLDELPIAIMTIIKNTK